MKKYRFLVGFLVCWIVSTIVLYALNIIFPSYNPESIIVLVSKTFGMSIVIAIVLLVALRKKNSK